MWFTCCEVNLYSRGNIVIVIDTESAETIVRSLCNIFKISETDLKILYMTDEHFEFLKSNHEDISLDGFYQLVKSADKLEDLKSYIEDLYVTSFHLSKRINPIEGNEKLYNLHSALLSETEIKCFFENHDIIFEKQGTKLKCIFKGQQVDWENFYNTEHRNVARLVANRLEGNLFYNSDNCINGFLFNHNIVNQSNVVHLSKSPEIVQNILEVLGLKEAIQEYNTNCLYIIKYRVKFIDFIFDTNSKLSNEEKFENLLKRLLQFLAYSLTNSETMISNPIVRTTDDLDVEPSDVCKFELVSI